MPIKAITFDFWSTIYQSKAVDYSQRLLFLKGAIEQGSGVEIIPEHLAAAVNVARHTWSQTWIEAYRTLTAGEWLVIMLRELNISLPSAWLTEIQVSMENSILDNFPTLAPQIEPVLANLSGRYRLGVISDTGITPGRVLRRILEQDKLTRYFSHLTFSDEVGRSKPHPTAFLTTLNHLGVTPSQAVHVGDMLRTDVAGAQAIGMRAVQYIGLSHDQANDRANGQKISPDAVINHHTELEPLLNQWNGLT